MKTLHLSVSFLFAALVPTSCWASIIPENFVYRNLSQYTVRYLSEKGRDTASCLANQGYPAPANSTVEHCRTLLFALTGSNNISSQYIDRVIVLALSGSYSLGDSGIMIFHSNHIILSRLPGEGGEVVLSCSQFDEFYYNNLFYFNSTYIALNDVVFTRCGAQSTAIGTLSVRTLVISNIIFR